MLSAGTRARPTMYAGLASLEQVVNPRPEALPEPRAQRVVDLSPPRDLLVVIRARHGVHQRQL